MFSVILFAFFSAKAFGVPASPGQISLGQPDGSSFAAYAEGDEWAHQIKTLSGLPVVKSAVSGYWEYARLEQFTGFIPTGQKVGLDNPTGVLPVLLDELRRIAPSIELPMIPSAQGAGGAGGPSGGPSGAPLNQTGSQKLIVILVNFADKSITTEASWPANIFGAASSVKDYYLEASYDQLTFTPAAESYGTANDGIVKVTLGYNHPNTGPSGFNDEANRTMVANALTAADPFVNFAAFDSGGNGSVSSQELHVVVIPAGYEQAWDGGGVPSIWAHRWCLSTLSAPYLDGVKAATCTDSGYSMIGELMAGTPDSVITIGTISHELGHDLGLPDLYDTDSSSAGIGYWSLMASGSWNEISEGGDSPAHPDAWCKWRLGWLTPIRYSASSPGVSVPGFDVAPGPDRGVRQILENPNGPETGGTGEYFLLENRRQTGYDAGLPGSGLLIWHIDETRNGNSDDARRLVDLEEADGAYHLDTKTNRGDDGDPYKAPAQTAFHQATNPNNYLYSSADPDFGIYSISAAAPTMTVDISIGGLRVSSISTPNATTMDVTFNMNVNLSASATSTGNYSIDGGIGFPSAAVAQPDGRTIRLTVSAMTTCVLYRLSLSGISANDATVLAPNASPVSFSHGAGVPGNHISSNTTWTAAAGPYCLATDTYVDTGAALTIEAGALVKFIRNTDADDGIANAADLIVHGKLTIAGTAVSPVTMTSAEAVPAEGDWGGIYFQADSDDSSSISYMNSSYSSSTVFLNSANPTIENSAFEKCGRYCIRTLSSYSAIKNNVFQNNATAVGNNVYIGGGGALLEGNDFGSCPALYYCVVVGSGSTFRNNRVHDAALGLSVGVTSTVAGNTFESMSERAVGMTYTGVDTLFKDNNFINNNIGLLTYGCVTTVVDGTHNYFSGNTDDVFNSGTGDINTSHRHQLRADHNLSASAVTLKTDITFTTDLGAKVKPGSVLYIQLDGVDGDGAVNNQTIVKVTSTSDATGIFATLTETAAGSGVYEGGVQMAAASSQSAGPPAIAAATDGVEITVAWVRDNSKSDSVVVDAIPPAQSNWLPAKSAAFFGTARFNTSETADCRWSLTDQAYADMAGDCTGDGTMWHTCVMTGMSSGLITVYTACRDAQNNEDTVETNEHIPYLVDFSAPTPPVAVNDGTAADIDFALSSSQLSANWSSASDPESGVAAYWYSIGTTAGASNTVVWTNVGAATSVTKTGLVLTNGQTYYVSVMAQNGTAIFATPTISDGQKIDASAPTGLTSVKDGDGTDIAYSSSTTRLSANWSAASDPDSGLARYLYAIGSTAGATDVLGWTDAGTATSAEATGLSLENDQAYYFSVKAENGAGLTTSAVSSNGVLIDAVPPAAPITVWDGAGNDVDYSTSLTTLSVNWAPSFDAESGVLRYWYCAGATPGASDTVTWRNTSLLSANVTALTLTEGESYYFTIMAEDRAGWFATQAVTDGVTIDTTEAEAIAAVNDGAGSDTSWTTSANSLSANWSAATDSVSGILRYWYSAGTTSGASNTISWTSAGTNTAVTKTGLTLVNGTTYYFMVKSENGAGLMSLRTYSNGQTAEFSAPTGLTSASDGAGTDIDYATGASSLSANWPAASDPETGVARYWYSAGTSAGASDTISWATTGTNSVAATGLTLTNGAVYYFSVKAENNAGLMTSAVTSDGVLIDTTAPTAPASVGMVLENSGGEVSLSASWTVGADTESGLKAYYYAIGTSSGAIDTLDWTSAGLLTAFNSTDSGLTPGEVYYFSVKAENIAGLFCDPISSTGVTVPSAVNEITDLAAAAGNDSVTLTWSNPSDADFMQSALVRSESAYPADTGDGEEIYRGVLESYTDNDVVNGNTYFYAIFACASGGDCASGEGSRATAIPTSTAFFLRAGWNQIGVSRRAVTIDTIDIFGENDHAVIKFDGGFSQTDDGAAIALDHGAGYWIFSEQEAGEITLKSGDEFTEPTWQVTLPAGWSIIVNPFSAALPWDDSHAALTCGGAPVELENLFHYTGAAYVRIEPQLGQLMPWRGYWIRLAEQCVLTLTR